MLEVRSAVRVLVGSCTHIHEQVRRGGAPCRSWRWRRVLAHVTHSQHSRASAQAARVARSQCAGRSTDARPPPHHKPPPATGCLISHYNLRAARFLPLLLPRFVLRIIECIPLAPAAMRARRRPDNSRVQLRRSAVTPCVHTGTANAILWRADVLQTPTNLSFIECAAYKICSYLGIMTYRFLIQKDISQTSELQ